jgi:hypothetical protein
MSKHRRRPCSHMEKVYKRAFELAVDKLDGLNFCHIDCEGCNSGLDCHDCIIAHLLQQAESEVEK